MKTPELTLKKRAVCVPNNMIFWMKTVNAWLISGLDMVFLLFNALIAAANWFVKCTSMEMDVLCRVNVKNTYKWLLTR